MSEKVSLETIGGGSAVILFQREFARVMANIIDSEGPEIFAHEPVTKQLQLIETK